MYECETGIKTKKESNCIKIIRSNELFNLLIKINGLRKGYESSILIAKIKDMMTKFIFYIIRV